MQLLAAWHVNVTCVCICSSLLPVPYAFSKTGVLLGLLVMLVVAGSNCLTSLLLLKAAGKTGHDSYEGMALAIGGPTHVSLKLEDCI